MDEILRTLSDNARVLDLGSRGGSFDEEVSPVKVTCVDLDIPLDPPRRFVQADAAALPFPKQTFEAVIANHSLEHFEDLQGVLREISRICRKDGALFVAVPDADTLTDRVYRWLARGGGHVNAFTSAEELARRIEGTTELPFRAVRVLYSSLSFLNRRNRTDPAPKKLLLMGGGSETLLKLSALLFRKIDDLLGTRLSFYGWALYFGAVEGVDPTPRRNVCVRCGSGHPQDELVRQELVEERWWGPARYRCPRCETTNYLLGA